MHTVQEISRAFAAAFALVVASSAFAADDGVCFHKLHAEPQGPRIAGARAELCEPLRRHQRMAGQKLGLV